MHRKKQIVKYRKQLIAFQLFFALILFWQILIKLIHFMDNGSLLSIPRWTPQVLNLN